MTTLTWADGSLLVGLLLALLFVAWRFGLQEGAEDFFLAGRAIPVWGACLSFLATEISAMTIIGLPATAFQENWNYAQFFIGAAAAKAAVAFLFIPAFYGFKCTSIYEFLRLRFGPASRYAAAFFFFVTRLLSSGVRLMAACMAVSVLIGWPIVPVIVAFSFIGAVYIAYGGVKAVVWTNVLQVMTFTLAGVATVAYIAHRLDGGLLAVWKIAGDAGRLDVWRPHLLWGGVFTGFFGSLAAFGTDHEMMQKLLTAPTARKSQLALLWSILGSFLVMLVFLSVGSGLFAFYQSNPGYALPEKLDKIYPHFAATVMPPGLRGLALAAIVMAGIDLPLASLAAVFVTDLYRPLIDGRGGPKRDLFVSRVSVVAFALLLGIIALGFSRFDKSLWLAFKIGGVTFGPLLGVFLFGLLSRRCADYANVVAMLAMALLNAWLLYLGEMGRSPIGWSWLLVLGTFGTWGLAWLLAPALDGRQRPA